MKKTRAENGRRSERGFTILETLVAIAILVISITGPMVFAQQSLRAANLARDQITAFYLAQDAIEFVKHVRDENSLSTFRDEWLFGLEDCFATETDGAAGCQVSTPEWCGTASTAEAVEPCGGEDCELWELPLGDGGKFFGIFSGTSGSCGVSFAGTKEESRFSRRVRIMTPEGGDPGEVVAPATVRETEEVLVEVEVSWSTTGLGGPRSVLVREHIYNWIQ